MICFHVFLNKYVNRKFVITFQESVKKFVILWITLSNSRQFTLILQITGCQSIQNIKKTQ